MNEFGRKSVHVLFGILIASFIWIVPKEVSVQILGIGLLIGLVLIDLSARGYHLPVIAELLSAFERPGVFPGKGAFYFVFSSLVTIILFSSWAAGIGIFVLAILDGLATIIGLKYGRIKIINHKSIEGSAGAIFVTGIVLIFILPLPIAALIAIIAGLIELFSPFDDNLLIPVIVAGIVTFLP